MGKTFLTTSVMEEMEVQEEKPLIIPPIHQSIPSTDPKDYLTVTQRYYTPLYHMDSDRERREDLMVLCHSNKICLISLAPSHPVIRHSLAIDKVNLETERKKYKVQAVVPGKLICMNKVILEDSGKVVSHHDSLGRIAILLPTKGQYESAKAKLISQEDYDKKIGEEEKGAAT